jgi:type II secretion system protein H
VGPVARASGRPPAPAGFTLVEVLVVLVILALAAGAAALALPGNDRDRAVREARRFAGALEHAAARAQVRAETLGASADGDAWRFWRRDPDSGRWVPVGDDDVLAARALPPPLTVAPLHYAGQPVDAGTILPLRPTGRNEPFAFVLGAGDARYVLAADPLNRIAVAPAAPP